MAFTSPASQKNYLSVLKTIPLKDLDDPSLALEDFAYKYNENGVMVHVDTGDKYHWVNQVQVCFIPKMKEMFFQFFILCFFVV